MDRLDSLTTSMVESSDEPSLFNRIVSACKSHASRKSSQADDRRPSTPSTATFALRNAGPSGKASTNDAVNGARDVSPSTTTTKTRVAHDSLSTPARPAPPPDENGQGEEPAAIETERTPNIAIRFYHVLSEILLSSWLNILLIFVPVGIGIKAAGVNPTIVFAVNAVAIVPLAGLLSHATESVASEMGDTIGALMNVTFGNAVELIILFVRRNPWIQLSLINS